MISFSKDNEANIPENIVKDMQSIYKTHSVTDSEVLKTIKAFYNKYDYLSDPHTATGLNILNKLTVQVWIYKSPAILSGNYLKAQEEIVII